MDFSRVLPVAAATAPQRYEVRLRKPLGL
jgi:hypothetical protein